MEARIIIAAVVIGYVLFHHHHYRRRRRLGFGVWASMAGPFGTRVTVRKRL